MHPAAAQSLLVSRNERIGPYVIGSVIGHFVLLGLVLLVSAFWGKPRLDLDQKPIRASLVRLGKPRDPKLLPRKEAEPAPPKEVKGADKPAAPVPTDKAVAVPIPGVKPSEKNNAKQSGQPDGEARRKALFKAFGKTAKPGKEEELEGAEDGDPFGDSATGEGERYFALLSSQVRRHYDVSSTISEQERLHLRAHVVISIGKTGSLLDVKLVKSSGNGLFDAAVLAAVKKAAPFSPPPEHLRRSLEREGVVLNFSP